MLEQTERLREVLELLELKGNSTDTRLFLHLCKTLSRQTLCIEKSKKGKGTMKAADEYGIIAREIAVIMSDVSWCGYSAIFWILAATDSNEESNNL